MIQKYKKKRKHNAEILMNGDVYFDDIPKFTMELLQLVAKAENSSDIEIIKLVIARKQKDVDILSALSIFLITYVSQFHSLVRVINKEAGLG